MRRNLGRQHHNSRTKMDGHGCKEKRAKKLKMCRNSQSPKRSSTKQSRYERTGLLQVQNFWWKNFRGT